MHKVATFTKTGTKAAQDAQLPAEIFAVEARSNALINQAYRAYLANGRTNTAQTLTRGLVRGGGKKPWRQKGTGRARVGSNRVPNWRGGGITFGPTGNENYSLKMPLKAKRLAIRQVLSAQASAGTIKIIEEFDIASGRVKDTLSLLKKLEVTKSVLLVVKDKTSLVDRATRNLAILEVVSAKYLNVFRLLNADNIIITKPALEDIQTWLGSKA